MARPLHCIIASVAVLGWLSVSFAQVVSLTGSTSASATVSSSATTPASTSSAPNFSLMSWRAASLTPYGQTTVTSSTTTTVTTPPPVIPSNTNPFVGATLSSQGSLTGGSTTTATSNSAASTAPTATARSSFSWRAVAYTLPTPEPLAPTGSLTGGFGTNNESVVTINLPVNLANAGGIAAVPEPSTIVMCVGLAAIVGYGYSRKKKVEKPVEGTPEPQPEPVAV